jgi:hypothetical protein
MEVYLEYKGLLYVCKAEANQFSAASHKQNLEAWLIFSTKVAPEIFNSIKLTCKKSAQSIWKQLQTNYATTTIYGIYRVWTNYTCFPYKNDLLKFFTKIKAALAKVNMIGIDTKQSVVSVTIMEKITEKRHKMMEHLLASMARLSNPALLLDKLRELANHEQVQQLKISSSFNHFGWSWWSLIVKFTRQEKVRWTRSVSLCAWCTQS